MTVLLAGWNAGSAATGARGASLAGSNRLHSATFLMPSRNIGCAVYGGFLRCDIRSGLLPEPARACTLDWTGVQMAAAGPAQPNCAGDTIFDPAAPVLQYGGTWSRGGITCASSTTGLRCSSGRHGFALARESWHTY
jgi:hypothetical protein